MPGSDVDGSGSLRAGSNSKHRPKPVTARYADQCAVSDSTAYTTVNGTADAAPNATACATTYATAGTSAGTNRDQPTRGCCF